MIPQKLAPKQGFKEDTFEDILYRLYYCKSPEKEKLRECKLTISIPDCIALNRIFPCILRHIKHNIPTDEWKNLTGKSIMTKTFMWFDVTRRTS